MTNIVGERNGSMEAYDPKRGVKTLQSLARSLDAAEFIKFIDAGMGSFYCDVNAESIRLLGKMPDEYKNDTRLLRAEIWVSNQACTLNKEQSALASDLVSSLPYEYRLRPLSDLVQWSQDGGIVYKARKMLKGVKARLAQIKSNQDERDDPPRLSQSVLEADKVEIFHSTDRPFDVLVAFRWARLNRHDVAELIEIALSSYDLQVALPACRLYLELPLSWRGGQMQNVTEIIESGLRSSDYDVSLPAAELAFLVPDKFRSDGRIDQMASEILKHGLWAGPQNYIKTLEIISDLPSTGYFVDSLRQAALKKSPAFENFGPDSWNRVLYLRSLIAHQLGVIKKMPAYEASS